MRAIVVCDTNVVVKWFRDEEAGETAAARYLLDLQRVGAIRITVLDLTWYELGNALMRGRARLGADDAMEIVTAARAICRAIVPTGSDLALAAELAAAHRLTFYDASYAATARRQGAVLATLDGKLLDAELGLAPTELVERIAG